MAMLVLDRARYRVHQFRRGLRPFLAATEIAEARDLLSEREFTLFLYSQPRDRRHAMDLYLAIKRHGLAGEVASHEALVAALVHDVGKGEIETWHRVAFVLLNALSPGLARRLESRSGARWRRALWRLRHHAAIGAEMLRRAGSSGRVVEIVEAHTDPDSTDREIEAFIRADDRV